MPTYYTQETTVQLSVASLEGTTTRKPATKQNDAVKEIIRSVTREFAQGSKDGTLTETSFFTEDRCIETHQKLAPSSMGFLGKNGTVPFFMVHAGNNFFDLTTKEDRNRSVIHGDCETSQLIYKNRLITLLTFH